MNRARRLSAIALIILMLGLMPVCLAQYSVPVQHTISTPYGNVSQTTNMPVGAMTYGTVGSISKKYKFTVLLKNDCLFVVKTRIEISGKRHVIQARINKRRIEIVPDQTKEIYRILDDRNTRLVGIPSDSCWLFLSIQGKISAYSYLAERNSEYIIAAQKYSGPIVKITEESLREMVEDNEKAVRQVEKKRFKKAIEIYNQRQVAK